MESVADPETWERGPRNMRYKPLSSAAIFLVLFLQGGGGGHGPLPPGSANGNFGWFYILHHTQTLKTHTLL